MGQTYMQAWHAAHHAETVARIATARAFVAKVRAETVCAKCGAQPIEWHNPAHEERPSRRISTMAGKGYSPEQIAAEIAQCTPLCRRCHVRGDGRLVFLKLGPVHPSCRTNRWPGK